MNPLSAYLERLRAFIPARTFALYVLAVGLVSGIAETPDQVRAGHVSGRGLRRRDHDD